MSMVHINRSTLDKLTHESTEIRLRTLEQVATKLERAQALNERVDLKVDVLCKQLIRWFGYQPVQVPRKVLQLLKSIIETTHYREKALKKLGAERLLTELRKVKSLLVDTQIEEIKLIREIKQILKNQEFHENNSVRAGSSQDDLIAQSFAALSLPSSNEAEYPTDLYEIPWSRPSSADFASMKSMADFLINPFANDFEIHKVIEHLQLTMSDYPAEYMLQAPHIFRNLLQLYDERKRQENQSNCQMDSVASTLLEFLNTLEKRLKMFNKSSAFPFHSHCFGNTTAPSQLKVEKALADLLEASIHHLELHSHQSDVSPVVWEVILKNLQLYENLQYKIDPQCLYKIASVVSSLSKKMTESDHCARLRLQQLQLIFLLQDVAQIEERSQTILDSIEVYEPVLRDYSLKSLFPQRHQQLQQLLLKSNQSLNEKYQLLEKYEKSFQLSIKLLINSNSLSCKVIIEQTYDVCLILDKLQSKHLIDVIFNAIIEAVPQYPGDPQLKSHAIDVLLKLLNLSFMPLKSYTYERLSTAFKRHIGCLMNGDCYTIECTNSILLEHHIIGVPLSSNLLLQIIYDSFETSDESIQNNCFKLLELLLQSKSLFAQQWYNLLPLFMPLMPLLNCCTMSKKLMDLLLKLYDPDSRQLPYVTALQGNLGFLFHPTCEQHRNEALTRLIYTLNALKGSEQYIPNLLEISDTLPNDLCILTTPREYGNIFNDHTPLRSDVVSSLNNLLQLLESPDVDPLIRKTSLMQINVLCCNWHITGELCSSGGCFLILQALENSLQHSSCSDYPDSSVPAISILNKVFLYDSAVRCELAETPNIYVLLLRGLMLNHNDIQVRQDATMCLFQLIFASHIIATETSIEAPLILGNIQMPLNIELKSALSHNISREEQQLQMLSMIFASALEERQYWRFVIADIFFNGLTFVSQKSLAKQLQLDVKDDLKLSAQDVRFIRATQPSVSLQRLLKAAANATDHKALIQACLLLKQQLLLPRFQHVLTISPELGNDLYGIVKKYLQLPPGNLEDLELYEHLLDVLLLSTKIGLSSIIIGFAKLLYTDFKHAFITTIADCVQHEIPMGIYYKICIFLKLLLKQYRSIIESELSSPDCKNFYTRLFDLLIDHSLQLLEKRDLERTRCLLTLLVALSACEIDMPDQYLFFYCRRFAQLSLALKSITQTGAQWHRDCLLAILQLSQQMQNSQENFRLSAGFVKYLSGLCGHNDVHVRILAWSLLYAIAKTKANVGSDQQSERKSSDVSGTELLMNELSYLPGGFMACCVSSLLDMEEVICVRQLAGHLLATLIRQTPVEDVKKIEEILEQLKFVRCITDNINSSKCILGEELPKDFKQTISSGTNIITCDLLNCYAVICIEVSLHSAEFLNDLCTGSFMFKLYEIIKLALPKYSKPSTAYVNMVAQICRLYAMCYKDNLLFLQRTICRDAVWIDCFCQILFQIVLNSQETSAIIDMLQLLMILCQDSTALEQLSIKMQEFSTEIVLLYEQSLAIGNINTRLQKCSLSVLSLLMIKSQAELNKEQSLNILNLFESQNVLTQSAHPIAQLESDNKENNNGNIKMKQKCTVEKKTVKENTNMKSSISEHICIALIRLFNHLYPIQACKFTTPPNGHQQQVTETLALLLKQSPVAQETANNLKLYDKVLKIFKYFFDEFSTTSCTTFVKRHGEHKKMIVIKNLQLIFKLILSWHSSPAMMITDTNLATELSKIIIQIWPWLAHSAELKLTVLQVSAFLSERSLVICKQFSTLNTSPFAHSVLQLVAKLITAETVKVKAASTDCTPVISTGLRVLMNCCSCVEGRTALNKAHTMDIFDGLHPFNPKAPQLKSEIIIAWLKFWEIFSRYEEGSQAHHLNSLCSVINKTKRGSTKRLISLRILRNMSFLNANRSTLITSNDVMYTINEIVSQAPMYSDANNCSVEEQLIVCLALWKLISGGIKFVAKIRATKLAKHLRVLRENLTCVLEENIKQVEYAKDLLNVLDIIFKIFNN